MLPTFIGLGAQRARTTWAYNRLAAHAEAFMTKEMELHFFGVNYSRGLEWYESQFLAGGGANAWCIGNSTDETAVSRRNFGVIAGLLTGRDLPRWLN
jgi:hypothetical protein